MGRRPCCSKEGVNRGAWSLEEDRILCDYVNAHGEGKWGALSRRAGLKRCGKSCRLRWLNYLRPGIKRGNFTEDEEDLIIRLHKLLGNRWSLIAGRLPGRSDNEIKNYWNTKLRKKMEESINESKHLKKKPATTLLVTTSNSDQLVQTKAGKCTKAFPLQHDQIPNEICASSPSIKDLDFNVGELLESNILESISMKVSDERMQVNEVADGGAWPSSCHPPPFKEDPSGSWGITQFPALDALDPSDENSQENGGVIGGWEILYGQYCNIWHDFNQGDSEIWWMGDSFQVDGGPELKV